MLKVLLCLAISFAIACNSPTRLIPEKPFVIISKENYIIGTGHAGVSSYMFTDKNKGVFFFEDSTKKYSLGDTIK